MASITPQLRGEGLRGEHIAAYSLHDNSNQGGLVGKKVVSQLRHSSTTISMDMYVEDAPSCQDVAEMWRDLPSSEQES